jgi:hypothetical protein
MSEPHRKDLDRHHPSGTVRTSHPPRTRPHRSDSTKSRNGWADGELAQFRHHILTVPRSFGPQRGSVSPIPGRSNSFRELYQEMRGVSQYLFVLAEKCGRMR